MNRTGLQRLKSFLPEPMISFGVRFRALGYVVREFNGRHKRICPICDYHGYFFGSGSPFLYDCRCPKCRSNGRWRQHFLLAENHPDWIDGVDLLHFAPEPCFVSDYSRRAKQYVRADYFAYGDETKVDIQNMQFADSSFDTIICHQIMEHVPDDEAAMSELFRVVRPGGTVLLSTPIVETWETTYENASVRSDWDRDLHFQQHDHVRMYGRDFRDLIHKAGFEFFEDVAREPEVAKYGLQRGEIIFVATKPVLAPQ